MKKKELLVVIAAFAFFILAGCHQHTWVPADCVTPKICSGCGETEGEPLGHDYLWETVREATCTRKGRKEGTCSVCGKKKYEDIDKLPHVPSGEWVVDESTLIETLDWHKLKLVQYCTVCGEVVEEQPYEFTEEEHAAIIAYFKENCKTYTYEEISRRPDDFKGKPAKFKGEVFQVMEDGNIVTLLIHVTKGKYNIWTDVVYVVYIREPSESRILENDIVTIYGSLEGTISYETVRGDSLTVPGMFAAYIELN